MNVPRETSHSRVDTNTASEPSSNGVKTQGQPNQDHLKWIADARRQADAAKPITGTGSSGAPRLGSAAFAPSLPDLPGYRIVREIHRGGQGVVYEAVQQSTQRIVALKVMREGPFAGEQDRFRFERETSILAQLSHRSIVGIIDRGVESGCHYFVMDYVDGQSLERFADASDLDLEDRLRLFAEICEAVNFAHLRGVIHRDLKPGNILIDREGQPRILDFGLAKSTGTEAASSAGNTLTGQFVGSLPWASPEQVQGDAVLIDTRTDVYSLGVMLFHLLTGAFPYRIMGNMRDVLDDILRAEPPPPSTLAGRSGIISSRANPARIDRDLDAIVLKCLRKDREARYQTAGELARDIHRYLAGEPIQARRQGTWYLFSKSLRRHRAAAVVAAGFVVLVIAASIISTGLWRMAVRQRDEAIAAQQRADTEAAKSRQIAQFAQSMLSGIDPATAGDLDKRLMRIVLDDAAGRVERELAGQPLVEASVRRTIGLSYLALGEWPAAATQLEKSLALNRSESGDMSPETLTIWNDLAMVYREQGRLPEAMAACEKAIEGRRQVLGEEHRDTLVSRGYLAEVYKEQGRVPEAEALNRVILEARRRTLGPEHPDTLTSMNNLAIDLEMMQRSEESESLLKQTIEVEQRVKGPTHPESMRTVNNLAILYMSMGKLEEAEQLVLEGLEMRRRVLGDDHPDTLRAMGTFAELTRVKGDVAGAEKLFREVVAEHRRVLGPTHPTLALHLYSLANLVAHRGDMAEAEQFFRESLEICRTSLPEKHFQTAVSQVGLGACLLKLKRFEEAETLVLDAFSNLQGNPEVTPYWQQSIAMVLMKIYEGWETEAPGTGKAEQAAVWRGRLEALTKPAETQPADEAASAKE